MEQPDLYNYKNYREFLDEYYSFIKAQKKKYSYRAFAEDLGFNASNFIHLIVKGKRNLSAEAVAKISESLKFDDNQRSYFKVIVDLEHEEDLARKKELEHQIEKLTGQTRVVITEEQHSFFKNWYIPILREVVSLKNFVSNLNWISKKLQPRVEEDDVKKGLIALEKLGMIQRVKNKWVQTAEHLATPMQVTSDQIHAYHKEMLGLSMRSLEIPGEQRDVSAMTMSLSQKQFEWLKNKVIQFRYEIQRELEDADDDHTLVAQLNMQLFPVTKQDEEL